MNVSEDGLKGQSSSPKTNVDRSKKATNQSCVFPQRICVQMMMRAGRRTGIKCVQRGDQRSCGNKMASSRAAASLDLVGCRVTHPTDQRDSRAPRASRWPSVAVRARALTSSCIYLAFPCGAPSWRHRGDNAATLHTGPQARRARTRRAAVHRAYSREPLARRPGAPPPPRTPQPSAFPDLRLPPASLRLLVYSSLSRCC